MCGPSKLPGSSARNFFLFCLIKSSPSFQIWLSRMALEQVRPLPWAPYCCPPCCLCHHRLRSLWAGPCTYPVLPKTSRGAQFRFTNRMADSVMGKPMSNPKAFLLERRLFLPKAVRTAITGSKYHVPGIHQHLNPLELDFCYL